MVVQGGLQFVAQPQQQAEARPEAHLILEEISKLMLGEGGSGIAPVHRELKRLPAREAGEVRKRERPPEVGAVREIDEPGFHDRPEAECMFPMDVGDKVLEIHGVLPVVQRGLPASAVERDRKSTRLNSSHLVISYAVFCLKKKKKK